MSDLETIYYDGYYVRSARGVDGFVAWAKREMFTGEDILDEPGNVWFRMAATRKLAIERLLSELSSNG